MDYKTYKQFEDEEQRAKAKRTMDFKGFCHIAPTQHLDLVKDRPVHLTLAHLIEQDDKYSEFYYDQKESTIIMDNSAFEMYKQGRPMYPSDRLIEMGEQIVADYIVMSDYPGEHSSKTIEAAEQLAPVFKEANFGTFFVPQSRIGDLNDLIKAYRWAALNPQLVDYVGVSILGVPNAYSVEKGDRMQRFNARLHFMYLISEYLEMFRVQGQKVHFLGMVDGPNEVMFMHPFKKYITTWDSSAAVWAGLNGIQFDTSPTGLINGKFEVEVDFDTYIDDSNKIGLAKDNMAYIDDLCERYLK